MSSVRTRYPAPLYFKEMIMSYFDWKASAKIADMVGKVFTSVKATGDTMVFENETDRYVFFHAQDCCESVGINDIVGDLSDLENEVLVTADEVEGQSPADFEAYESYTWTFYKFATRKGYVDVRWLGESNGYYSESVDLGYEKV